MGKKWGNEGSKMGKMSKMGTAKWGQARLTRSHPSSVGMHNSSLKKK